MRFRKLGNTGLIVSEMCLGAMTFGSGEGMWATVAGVSQEGVTDLIKTAFDRGINFIDTADFYSNGRSEVVTGNALKMLGAAARFVRAGHQGAAAHGSRPQPDRPLARAHHAGRRREPEAPAGRSHRPVPDPRPRSVHAARGNARCTGRLRARRQGALPRAVQSVGLGDHEVAVDFGQEESRALREPADVLLGGGSRHRARDRAAREGSEPRHPAVEPARGRTAVGQVLARERETRRCAPRHARFPARGSRARVQRASMSCGPSPRTTWCRSRRWRWPGCWPSRMSRR